jgi:hypothetical protein
MTLGSIETSVSIDQYTLRNIPEYLEFAIFEVTSADVLRVQFLWILPVYNEHNMWTSFSRILGNLAF